MYSFYQMPHLKDVQLAFDVLLSISAKEKVSVDEINFSLWDASLTVLIWREDKALGLKSNPLFQHYILYIEH